MRKIESSIGNIALLVTLASALLLSVTSANAACADQSIIYGQTVNGSLSATDCTDFGSTGATYYADYYLFTGAAGDKISLQLSSSGFDPWLTLFFPSGNYTNNDNGGGGTSARIPATSGYYTLLESGTYRLEATSYTSNTTGSYALTLAKEASTAGTLPTAPTNVTAIAGDGSAIVTFTPGSIGSGTLVKYWAACGVDNTHLIIIKGSSSPITVTGLTNGTAYYCWALTESTVGYSSAWSIKSNLVTPTATTATSVPVVEFYNTNLDNYFITADASEAAQIDGGSAGLGWIRTGNTFMSGGSASVCRFYGSYSPGPNSHFYTVDPSECQGLKDQQFATGDPRILTDKSWNFESLDFVSTQPTNGTCPGGTVPVYRAYNNGSTRGVDSNHRITSNLTAINQQVACGWSNEGIVMCAPSGTTSGGTTNCGSGGSADTIFTLMTNPTDGHILSAKSSDGTIVRYYGRRDADGIPASIDNIQVAATDGKTTRIELDLAKRPTKMRSPDGVVFDLTYSGNQAVVTAVSPDGLTQVSTTFPIGTAASSQVPVHSSISSINGIGTDRLPLVGSAASNADGFQSDWVISVNKCDVGVDNAFVSYAISDSNGSPLAQGGEAENIGGGKYVASIPTNLKPPLNNNQILNAAEAIADKLGNVCDALDYLSPLGQSSLVAGMCPAITYVLLPTGPGSVAIGTACEAVSAAVTLYCKTLGNDGPPEAIQANHPSLVNIIIAALKDPNILPDVIRLKAFAYTPGILYGDFSEPINVKASGPFQPTTISIMVPDGSCPAVVTALAGTGGSISPSSATVDHGKTTSFTVTPNTGYSIASVTGCGGTLIGNTYITEPITANCTVSTTFTPNPSGTTSATMEQPGYWAHLSYTISGSQLNAPTGDLAPYHNISKVETRTYTGKLAGTTLTVSGTAVSDNESSGAGSGDYYIISVSVTVGTNTKTFEYIAPKGEKLNKPFSVFVPVDSTATSGSFSINLFEKNTNWGTYGYAVSGSLTK